MSVDTIPYNMRCCSGCGRWIPNHIGVCPWCQTEQEDVE